MEGHEVMLNDDRVVESMKKVLDELYRAEHLHPVWPSDPVHQVSILMEEAGEAVQAANDIVYEMSKTKTIAVPTGPEWENTRSVAQRKINAAQQQLRRELIQTGAMVIRCLINLEN